MSLSSPQIGTVTKSTGSWYKVRLADGSTVDARTRGKMKLDGAALTNPIAVGDHVRLELETDGNGLIDGIEPRKNYIARQSPRQKHKMHLIASNLDAAILVVTLINPNLKQGFIDRFLLMTEPQSIPVILLFNKADLWTEEERYMFEALKEIYEPLDYTCIATSVITNEGIDVLKQNIQDKTTLIAGQSGVGKSSILNTLHPDIGIKTAEISERSGKGQHTTTFAEMFAIDAHTYVIDTPGIKTLSFNNLEVEDVVHNFVEIFERSEACRYGNCTHREEPGCAVKTAIEQGEISPLRYQNYLLLIEEIEAQNYWERKKGPT